MEAKMKYLSYDIAKYFGSRKNKETIHLSENATYEHVLSLLEKKYERAFKQLHGGKLERKMLDAFIFITEGRPLRTMQDKIVNPDREVLVAYADFGG
jgi:hypothetical protein